MYVRTTTLGSNDSLLNYMLESQSRYYELSTEASSGKKVAKPSDDPAAAKSIMDINARMSQLNNYVDSMKTAQPELNSLDDALTSLTTLIQKASDLTTQASNGTYNQSDLDTIKTQIDSIVDSVIDISNTQYNGTYIFSGTATSTTTYTTDASGNIVYNGTPSTGDYKRYVTISDGVPVAINTTGDQVFGSYTAAIPDDPSTPANEAVPASGTGIIGTLKLLSDALGTGNKTVINSSIDALSNNLDSVSAIQTKFASVTNRFSMTQSSINDTITTLKGNRTDLQDADITKVYSDLAAQQIAMQASYQIASEMLGGKSLLDYL